MSAHPQELARSFVGRNLSETLAQYRRRAIHDEDFLAFAKLVSSVNVILDVGANRGQSIASFRVMFARAEIHAFEANPTFFDVLDELAGMLPGPTLVHKYGLGRQQAVLRFFIPWVGDVAFLEESTTRPDYFSKPWVLEKYRQRGQMRLEEIDVEVRNGDQLLLHPDIIKLDVEGAEHEVLMGLKETIEATRPFLLIENSDWENVTPYLDALGYAPFRWEPVAERLAPYQGVSTNTIYVHRERLADAPIG